MSVMDNDEHIGPFNIGNPGALVGGLGAEGVCVGDTDVVCGWTALSMIDALGEARVIRGGDVCLGGWVGAGWSVGAQGRAERWTDGAEAPTAGCGRRLMQPVQPASAQQAIHQPASRVCASSLDTHEQPTH